MGANEKFAAAYHNRTRYEEVTRMALEAQIDGDESLRYLYTHNPVQHYQMKMLAMTLAHFDHAAREEGVDDHTTARILNRVLYGAPDGTLALRRERLRMVHDIYAKTALTPPPNLF